MKSPNPVYTKTDLTELMSKVDTLATKVIQITTELANVKSLVAEIKTETKAAKASKLEADLHTISTFANVETNTYLGGFTIPLDGTYVFYLNFTALSSGRVYIYREGTWNGYNGFGVGDSVGVSLLSEITPGTVLSKAPLYGAYAYLDPINDSTYSKSYIGLFSKGETIGVMMPRSKNVSFKVGYKEV